MVLCPVDVDDVLGSEGLEKEFVGGVVIGGDGLWVGVDHDSFEAVLTEGKTGVDAAVIEFDPLADPVGAAAQNQNFGLGGRAGLVVVRIVRGVEVGGVGLEFGGAGVDEAKGGEELLFFLPSADGAGAGCQFCFRTGEQTGEIEIRQPGEAGFPEQRETGGIPQPGLLLDPAGDLGDFLKIIEKPRVNFGDLVNAFDRPPPIQRMAEVP